MLEQVPGLIMGRRDHHILVPRLTHSGWVLGQQQVLGLLVVGRLQVMLSNHSKGLARATRTGSGM